MLMSLPSASTRRPPASSALLLLTLPIAGCQGVLTWPSGPESDQFVSPAHGDPSSPDSPDDKPEACTATYLPPRLVLLSDFQHANSIRSLFGAEALPSESALSAQTKPFTQKGVVVNASLVHSRQSWASEATKVLEEHFTEFTGCPTEGSDECARTFIEAFAPRAFRRPVEAEEIDDLLAVYTTGKTTSFVNGVIRMVEAALSAPSFMYRRELGTPDDSGTLRLLPEELASTLSFMLTDAPPDDALLRAAANGELDNPKGIAAQVERLLQTESAQDSLVTTIMAAWGVSNLFGTVKDPSLFPEYGPSLSASMFRETELFLRDVFWTKESPLTDLLTSRETFVNPALADLYGVEYSGSGTDFVEVTLPDARAGVLTQASLLTMLSRTDNTSVVARGLFVRGALLCLPKIPSPPEGLTGAIEELLEADMTERERAEVRATTQPCGGCHAGFDAFGLMLENFDALGQSRSEIEGEPVDTSVSLTQPASLASDYPDITSFAAAAAQEPEFVSCVATKLLSYATNDDTLSAQDCRVTQVVSALPGDTPSLRELIQAVTSSPALSLRAKVEDDK